MGFFFITLLSSTSLYLYIIQVFQQFRRESKIQHPTGRVVGTSNYAPGAVEINNISKTSGANMYIHDAYTPVRKFLGRPLISMWCFIVEMEQYLLVESCEKESQLALMLFDDFEDIQ